MFAVKSLVSFKNYGYRHTPCPENVKDIYDKKDYDQWHKYFMAKFRFGMIDKAIGILIVVVVFLLDGFVAIENWINTYIDSYSLQTLAFLGFLGLVSNLISLPFDYHNTFVIEENFGFNKTTKKTFFTDKIKEIILTVVLGGGILLGTLKLVDLFDDNMMVFILSLWGASVAFMLIMSLLTTKVFVKIFNKLTPLEEGSLKTRINDLADQLGFDVKSIWVMDASKRSTKLNAFFSGFGKMKDVVLFDTLIEKLSEDEILSVLAHELGHSVNKDVLKGIIKSIFTIGLYISVLGAFLFQGSYSFGYTLIILGVIYEPITMILGLFMNKMSRKAEYRADAFSSQYVDKAHMISALKVLSRENFSNLTPHPIYVSLYYSHPPTSDRIKALEAGS